jgi:hypothetical protein
MLRSEEGHEDFLEAPEIHNQHARHGGGPPRWLGAGSRRQCIVYLSQLDGRNGRAMERLVNSVPYMQGGFSDVTPEGQEVLSLDLLNRRTCVNTKSMCTVLPAGRPNCPSLM